MVSVSFWLNLKIYFYSSYSFLFRRSNSNHLENEIALVEFDAYDARLEELNVDAALNYATDDLRKRGGFGFSVLRTKNRAFGECYFQKAWSLKARVIEPFQLVFAFSYCRGFQSLASQSIPSWNQILAWLKEMETLRQNAA